MSKQTNAGAFVLGDTELGYRDVGSIEIGRLLGKGVANPRMGKSGVDEVYEKRKKNIECINTHPVTAYVYIGLIVTVAFTLCHAYGVLIAAVYAFVRCSEKDVVHRAIVCMFWVCVWKTTIDRLWSPILGWYNAIEYVLCLNIFEAMLEATDSAKMIVHSIGVLGAVKYLAFDGTVNPSVGLGMMEPYTFWIVLVNFLVDPNETMLFNLSMAMFMMTCWFVGMEFPTPHPECMRIVLFGMVQYLRAMRMVRVVLDRPRAPINYTIPSVLFHVVCLCRLAYGIVL